MSDHGEQIRYHPAGGVEEPHGSGGRGAPGVEEPHGSVGLGCCGDEDGDGPREESDDVGWRAETGRTREDGREYLPGGLRGVVGGSSLSVVVTTTDKEDPPTVAGLGMSCA